MSDTYMNHCEIHRGLEWMQVNVPLVDVKVRTSSYLVLIFESVTVARI